MDELLDNRMLVQRLVVVLRGEIAWCIDPRYTGPRCESSWIQDFEFCKSETMSSRGQVVRRQARWPSGLRRWNQVTYLSSPKGHEFESRSCQIVLIF